MQQPEIKRGRLMALINALSVFFSFFFFFIFFLGGSQKIYTKYLFYAIITFLNETVLQ